MFMKGIEKHPVDTDLGENYFQDWPGYIPILIYALKFSVLPFSSSF